MLTRRAGMLIFFGLGMVAAGAGAQTGAALPGTLAYIRGGVACVATAAGGPEQTLPESKGAEIVSLCPTGGIAVFFVRQTGAGPGVTRGYVSRMPFTRATPLPAPLDRATRPAVTWTRDGKLAFISGTGAQPFSGRYRVADGSFQPDTHPVGSASQDGQVTAWTTDGRKVEVQSAGGPLKTVFSSGQPEPMFAAIRKARNPDGVAALRNVPRAVSSQSRNWAIGEPALTPDGKRLFFAGNAGDRVAATGTTNFCLFAADLQTNELAVLSRLGVIESSRIPKVCRVSPDNKRLLFVSQTHVAANATPGSLYVLNLANQESRDLIACLHLDERELGQEAHVLGEPVWSPDGRYVAVSMITYELTIDAARKEVVRPWIPGKGLGKAMPLAAWKPREDDYELHVFDAATTKRVRTLTSAVKPSWSR